MKRVLVTGGTGSLGEPLVAKLAEEGYIVRVMSRRDPGSQLDEDIEWAIANIRSGDGLEDAVDDVDIVVHAATNPMRSRSVDLKGTKKLLDRLDPDDLELFVYVSIVGIDAWESVPFPYYNHKLAAEEHVEESDVPTVIQRATQFYSLFDGLFSSLRWSPAWLLPKNFKFQPASVEQVSAHLVNVVSEQPQGRSPDIGGPEILNLGELAKQWQQVRDIWRPVGRLPFPGSTGSQMRDGVMTVPENRCGGPTWKNWLDGHNTEIAQNSHLTHKTVLEE